MKLYHANSSGSGDDHDCFGDYIAAGNTVEEARQRLINYYENLIDQYNNQNIDPNYDDYPVNIYMIEIDRIKKSNLTEIDPTEFIVIDSEVRML